MDWCSIQGSFAALRMTTVLESSGREADPPRAAKDDKTPGNELEQARITALVGNGRWELRA